MLNKIEYVYDVIENLEEKGYEISDLEIHDCEVIITYKQYGIKMTMKFNLKKVES